MKIPMLRAALAAGLLAAVSCGFVGRAAAGHCDPGPVQGSPGEFDFYLMALSVVRPLRNEGEGRQAMRLSVRCRLSGKTGDCARTMAEQIQYGNEDQPRHCTDDPAGQLPSDLYRAPWELHPGVADGLEQCEWAKHGVCTTFSYEDYYGAVVALAAIAKTRSAPRSTITI